MSASPADENSSREHQVLVGSPLPLHELLVGKELKTPVMEKDGLGVTLRDGWKVKTHGFK